MSSNVENKVAMQRHAERTSSGINIQELGCSRNRKATGVRTVFQIFWTATQRSKAGCKSFSLSLDFQIRLDFYCSHFRYTDLFYVVLNCYSQ